MKCIQGSSSGGFLGQTASRNGVSQPTTGCRKLKGGKFTLNGDSAASVPTLSSLTAGPPYNDDENDDNEEDDDEFCVV